MSKGKISFRVSILGLDSVANICFLPKKILIRVKKIIYVVQNKKRISGFRNGCLTKKRRGCVVIQFYGAASLFVALRFGYFSGDRFLRIIPK